MTSYVALLRAINLGSHHRIAMPELKAGLESLGYARVETYLQSGQVVFRANSSDAGTIEAMIKRRFGHDIKVILLTAAQLQEIAQNNRLIDPGLDETKLHLTFLLEPADPAKLASIPKGGFGSDQWQAGEGVIYLYCPNGYGRSKLANSFWERKLKTLATTRNWQTVRALLKMLS